MKCLSHRNYVCLLDREIFGITFVRWFTVAVKDFLAESDGILRHIVERGNIVDLAR